ncbi:hypothetical protein [Streptomyces nigrescens]
MSQAIRCSRCNRRYRKWSAGADQWNAVLEEGYFTGIYLCPRCQTPEENLEAEVKESTLDYERGHLDEQGRMRTPAKGAVDRELGMVDVGGKPTDVQLIAVRQDDTVRVGVNEFTDLRIAELLCEGLAPGARKLINSSGSAHGGEPRSTVMVVSDDLEPGTVAVERAETLDHQEADVISVPRDVDCEVLTAFTPEIAAQLREKSYTH